MVNRTLETQSPVRMLFIAAFSVFVAETAIMLVLPLLPNLSDWAEVLLDSTLLLVLLFPMLYWFMYRPRLHIIAEHREARAELHKTRAELEHHIAQLEEHSRQTALLREMANLFLTSPSAEEAYQVIAEYTQRLFTAESGALYAFNASRNLVEMIAEWGQVAPGEDVFAGGMLGIAPGARCIL